MPDDPFDLDKLRQALALLKEWEGVYCDKIPSESLTEEFDAAIDTVEQVITACSMGEHDA
jgi:hypothetical protein